MLKALYLIPARGGSKGIPGKNIKKLAGRPLIQYTLDVARELAEDEDICVSTDSEDIKVFVEKCGLHVPFNRPDYLASDVSGMHEVVEHALDFYEGRGKRYDLLVLLQPTSPFRKASHVKEAMALYQDGIDMVVSVKETDSNPYYTLFRENEEGYLQQFMKASFVRRQDCPMVWEYNGAVYVINAGRLKSTHMSKLTRNIKYVMSRESSIDVDTPLDWELAEVLLKKRSLL